MLALLGLTESLGENKEKKKRTEKRIASLFPI